MRLSQFIAHAGVCSRRKAAHLILEGEIKVNGLCVTDLSYQVADSDVVTYGDKVLTTEKKTYLLFNKPLDTITTAHDPMGRRTVMDFFNKEMGERLYPVGRLDCNTTGIILITNDGPLAHKLSHPSSEVPKVYMVTLQANLSQQALQQIREGVMLKDGLAKVDEITAMGNLKTFRLRIHSGKNRIIRRIFGTLGCTLTSLDRVQYAHLKKGSLPLGRWRRLTEGALHPFKEWRGEGYIPL